MTVDALGNLVCSPVDFVIFTGIDKNAKPYKKLVFSNQRGFDIGRNETAVGKLVKAGVKEIPVTHAV